MSFWKALVGLVLLVVGLNAYADSSAPTLVNLPCRDADLVALVKYYTTKAVTAQVHTDARVELSRFSQSGDNPTDCIARVDVSYAGDEMGDMGWVSYSLPSKAKYKVLVSYDFSQSATGYRLATESDPQLLDSTLLAEMKAAQAKEEPVTKLSGPSLPIVKFEVLREARERLLAAGWHPLMTSRESGIDLEKGWRDAGYPEVGSCAVDVGACRFNYVDDKGDCLLLYSEGEEPEGAFVHGWDFSCSVMPERKTPMKAWLIGLGGLGTIAVAAVALVIVRRRSRTKQ